VAKEENAMTKPALVAVSLLTAAASLALWQPAGAQGDTETQLGVRASSLDEMIEDTLRGFH